MSKLIQASNREANRRQLSNAELLRKVKTAFLVPSGRNDEITLWSKKRKPHDCIFPIPLNHVWDLFLTREGHKSQFLDAITRFIAQVIVSIETGANDGMRDILEQSFHLVIYCCLCPSVA
jgi:hypothetical protein